MHWHTEFSYDGTTITKRCLECGDSGTHPQCQAWTLKARQCKSRTIDRSSYECRLHGPNESGENKARRQANRCFTGGIIHTAVSSRISRKEPER